jgi:hypothetical protein
MSFHSCLTPNLTPVIFESCRPHVVRADPNELWGIFHHDTQEFYMFAQACQANHGLPIVAHAKRRLAKKIRGRLHHFGPWNDPDAALQKYLDQKEALHRGYDFARPKMEAIYLPLESSATTHALAVQRRVSAASSASEDLITGWSARLSLNDLTRQAGPC